FCSRSVSARGPRMPWRSCTRGWRRTPGPQSHGGCRFGAAASRSSSPAPTPRFGGGGAPAGGGGRRGAPPLVREAAPEAARRRVALLGGSSFGFDTTRIYLTAEDADSGEPFVR